MSINIKEIFQSDNLSVSQDKINYNFDQILANGGGPQGLKGEKGATGALGSIGPKGEAGLKGDTGPIGLTGADGYFTLESYTSPDQHTLLPKIQPTDTSAIGEKPTNLVLGRIDTSYLENEIDKNALLVLSNQNNGTDFTDLIRFRILDNDQNYSVGSAAIRVIPTNDVNMRLKIMTLENDDILEIQSDNIVLSDRNNSIKIQVTSSQVTVNGNVNLNGVITINTDGSLINNGNSSLLGDNTIGAINKTNTITGTTNITGTEFKINPSGALPALNKILVAQDNNGKALWKKPTEVMEMYPIGSIMFVNPTDITNTYFHINNAIDQETIGPDGNVFTSFFGRGRANNRWAGWYLLFGQTNAWFSGTTLISYVPTNIPGSLLIGASAPDNTNLIDDEFKSSMGTQGYNPPIGYGTDYKPSLRGNYSGVGAQGIVVGDGSLTNVGDLLTLFPSDVDIYDKLDSDAIVDSTGQSSSLEEYSLHDSGPTFHALPMAVYLGTTSLIYNQKTSQSSSGE